ncbi:MAG: hypothetical protein Kow0092_32060 [Deferrisomatales bacterium]
MQKFMFVNVVNEEESRIAIVSDGLLEELSIETSRHEQIEGNIYKAKIVKVIPSLDAVFVDYGGNRNGFLAVSDIHPRYLPNGERGAAGLRVGQELLVQVRKGEIGQKGAALTTYVSIPGRYFVLMPFVGKRGVSRKIEDEATRKQLRQALDDAGVPGDMGFIARTAAEGRTKQDLQRDAGYLMRLWKRIQKDEQAAAAPALLYQDSDIVIRTLRDYFNPSIREVWIDDKEIFDQVQSFFRAVMPWYGRRLKLYQGKKPLFSKYNLEEQIASIYEKKVPLPSGGSIVIEQTEALVSIDVNSGKSTKGKDIEETAVHTNLEAAQEAVRQLRLRDLGGLVVIDFIDMRRNEHRQEVRKALQKGLKEDKARTDVGTISKFGLLELSRQRIKASAGVSVAAPCPTCGGLGKVRSPESFALAVLRTIQSELARRKGTAQVLVGVPQPVATLLLNRKRRQIAEMEGDFQAAIAVFGENALGPNQYYIEYRSDGAQKVDTNLPEEFPRALLLTPKGLPEVAGRTPRPPSYATVEAEDEAEGLLEEEASAAEPEPRPEEPAEEKPGRKRRRRRRRKKPEDEREAPSGEPAPEEAAAPATPGPAAPAGEEPAEAPGEAAGEGPPADEGAPAPAKPRRRSRRSRGRGSRRARKPEEAAPQQAAGGAPEAPTEAPPSGGAEPPSPPSEAEPVARQAGSEAADAQGEPSPPTAARKRSSRPRRRPSKSRARSEGGSGGEERAPEGASAETPPDSAPPDPKPSDGSNGPEGSPES